jgi:hypothetical protein
MERAFKRREVAVVMEGKGESRWPRDVLKEIFHYLDGRTLLLTRLVCKSWFIAASQNDIWGCFIPKTFQLNEEGTRRLVRDLHLKRIPFVLFFLSYSRFWKPEVKIPNSCPTASQPRSIYRKLVEYFKRIINI